MDTIWCLLELRTANYMRNTGGMPRVARHVYSVGGISTVIVLLDGAVFIVETRNWRISLVRMGILG